MMIRISLAALFALFSRCSCLPNSRPAPWPSTPTTSAGSCRARRGPRPASGSSPRRPSCRTKFRKIVVTDDRGRYLVPDLPRGDYAVWVRGYGLADSKPVNAPPGKHVNLPAVAAPTPQEAAAVYPANYWYSLIKGARQERVPWHRSEGQRHRARHADAGRLDQPDEGWLPAVPSDGQPRDARDSQSRSAPSTRASRHGIAGSRAASAVRR